MDRKTVLAVVLSLTVILMYQFFILPPTPPPRPPVGQPTTSEPATPPPQMMTAPLETALRPAGAEVISLLAAQQGAAARELRIDTGLAQITLNSLGGSVAAWRLHSYRDQSGQPLELAPRPIPGLLPPLAVQFKDEELTRFFAEGAFLVGGGDQPLDAKHNRETVTLSRVDPSGVQVTKKITFQYDSYFVEVEIQVRNLGPVTRDLPWWLIWGPAVGREGDGGGKFSYGPLVFTGEKVMDAKPKKDGERFGIPAGFRWIGLNDRYFLAAFLPATQDGEAFIQRQGKAEFTIGAGPRATFLPAGGAASLAGTWFVGPKSQNLLKSYRLGLEYALNFGWSGWLGRPLLAILQFFHRFVGNWGVAIILLTFLVRLCLFPVSFHMYKSMRRMQEFQPQIQALKKKYKDNSQAMNQEMMDLYRAHNINPMGGCLPMLIQIPIFFALYRVLSIAIELRGSGFLHIQDLSAGETTLGQFFHYLLPVFPEGLLPLKILVILMGVTMFIQQRLSPAMGDPRQAKMMMFLPIIFTAMFWTFTSGLVVYFLFSNLLALGEQLLIRKWSAPREAAAVAPGKRR